MRKVISTFLVLGAFTAVPAMADDEMIYQEPGSLDESSEMSDDSSVSEEPGMVEEGTSEQVQEDKSGFWKTSEMVGIRPQVGLLAFDDPSGDNTSRFAAGLTVDMNATRFFTDQEMSNFYVGPSTGLIYSHLGDPGSNFFGTDSDRNTIGAAGANLLLIPVNAKVGIGFGKIARVSVHGGGNVTYRSAQSSLQLDDNRTASTESDWGMYPNVGADLELGLFTIRPDWTITPGDDIYAATIGFSLPLG